MRKIIGALLFLVTMSFASAQHVALKNNLLYDATGTPNLALEFAFSKKTTLDIYGGVNPFTFSDGKKWKHWLAQPEFRYWFCEAFNGAFIGVHGHVGQMNVANVKGIQLGYTTTKSEWGEMNKYRYEGWFYGGGVSLGYQFILGDHWNLEASVGGGYIHFDYDKYNCGNCGTKIASDLKKDYFGLTRATISLVYLFN
ncbi:DUF3575 domain-containing protein [Porphyromonas pogonae]|uniref:DUF3575 domain-containing protein n=1 Tax=Porphyromonas pogonae TaxID=867595 RepID=UPI002E793108|nr:DUF3575 domain-containing protein [Porphyromonas pogonae]